MHTGSRSENIGPHVNSWLQYNPPDPASPAALLRLRQGRMGHRAGDQCAIRQPQVPPSANKAAAATRCRRHCRHRVGVRVTGWRWGTTPVPFRLGIPLARCTAIERSREGGCRSAPGCSTPWETQSPPPPPMTTMSNSHRCRLGTAARSPESPLHSNGQA